MQQRYVALDGLRGVAALMVVAHHLQPLMGVGEGVLGRGFLAVDFFFVLSGFVVASAYERRLQGGLTFLGFVKIRLIRLYPMIAAGALVGGAVELARGNTDHFGPALLAQLLLIPGMAAGTTLFLLNPVHWSLFFELLANFGHALTLKWVNTRLLMAEILVAAIALLITGAKMHHLGGGWGPENWWAGLVRVGFSYPLGVLMYRLHAAGSLPGFRMPFWLLSALLMGALAVGSLIASWPGDAAIIIFAFPSIVALGIRAATPAAPQVVEALGVLSFPLYAIHAPIVTLWAEWAPHSIASAAAALALCVALAFAAERFYDRPARRALAVAFAGPLKPRSAT